MKRHQLSLILVSLMVFTSLIGFLSMNGLGSATLTFTFENDNIYTNENPTFYEGSNPEFDNYNVRNTTTITIANLSETTYSFTDDAIGSNPVDWSDDSGASCSVEVASHLTTHLKVMTLIDIAPDNAETLNSFSHQTSGTVEFWFSTTDIGEVSYVRVLEGVNEKILLRFWVNVVSYHDGGGYRTIGAVVNDVWYHLRIDFESGNGGYLGLDPDHMHASLNGGNQIINDDYEVAGTGFDAIKISTAGGDVNYTYDAFGYHWDPFYNLSDNWKPTRTIDNSPKEVDKFRFSLKGVDEAYPIGHDNPSGWTDKELPSGDWVNIGSYPSEINKKVVINCNGATSNRGLGRDDFNTHGDFFNITFGFEFLELSDATGGTLLQVYSYDDTLIAELKIFTTGILSYKDAGYTQLRDDLGILDYYEFFLMIDYDLGNCIFDYYVDGVYIHTYVFPLLSLVKEGIKRVVVDVFTFSVNTVWMELDYIGVYAEGVSLAEEYSYLTLEIGELWDFQKQNLFTINATGEFGIYATQYNESITTIPHVAGFGLGLETVRPFRNYSGQNPLFNLFDIAMNDFPSGMNNSFLVFYLLSGTISLSYINIEGVKLNEGINEYWIEFTHSNVNINESYFYVDSSDKLRFQISYNNSNLEYIQADFDITNVLAENRSLRLKSKMSGNYGFFSVRYTDATDSTLEFPVAITSHNVILPQSKTIDKFTILITDNDELSAGGGSGYVSNIQLIWNPSISITITTISLIMIMIPIIIMIVPTLTLYSKYGKSVIMPTFIFMAIICFAGGLIPGWVFFILMLGAGGFLVLKKGSGDI